jgi:hypothetical protein
MGFDLSDAFIAVYEQRLVSFRIERAGSGFERHLLGERAHGPSPRV